MKKAIIGLLGILGLIPIVCHAHAGMYDRYLELMNVLFALLKTIFLSQIVVFVFIKFSLSKFQKNIRLRLLLLAKRLCKNWWVNIIATWTISSFAISSYLYVFFMGAWLLAIVIFPIFWIIYLIIIAKSKTRERFFSGLRPIYYYLVASIGQIIVFIALFLINVIVLYGPIYLSDYLWGVYRFYSVPFGDDGGYILAKGMLEISICLAVPYLFLVLYRAIRFAICKSH